MTDNTNQSVKKSSSSSSLKSVGMGPSLRMNSTDIRQLTKETEGETISKLTPEGGAPPGDTVYDCMAFLIYCQTHKKFALTKTEKAVWMPFVVSPVSKTFSVSAEDGVRIVLSKGDKELDATLQKRPPVKDNIMTSLTRIQLPNNRFITRAIQFVKLDKNNNDFQCCQNTKRLQWVKKSDVLTGNIEKLWGPEVTQTANNAVKAVKLKIEEFSIEDVMRFVTTDSPKSTEEKILKALAIQQKDVEQLYSDFIEQCFPSFFMTIDSFKDYVTNYGYEDNDSRFEKTFNAFCMNGNHFISFLEFILGLAAMEPNCPHEEFRLRFIFRYYDSDRDKHLNEKELKTLFKDMSNKNSDIDAIVKEFMKICDSKENKLSIDNFLSVSTSKGMERMSKLCRSSKPVFAQINKSMAERSKKKSTAKTKSGFLTANRPDRGVCYGCRAKKYDYGLHSVKFDMNGRCVEPRRILEPDSLKEEMNEQRFSMEYKFNTRSIAHVFIDLIRDYSLKKAKDKNLVFLVEEREIYAKYLINLCSDLKSVFNAEDRVIKLNSPTVIVGDISGNLDDLMTMEKLLWQSFPVVSANYLFLGNYVDSGQYGIECIVYLFSLKLIAPNKVFLLRGNQEVRECQNTFKKECIQKYGDKVGYKLWELINEVLDKLPISVVVDESILCVHGGIPRTSIKLEDINTIPKDLKNPEKESILAHELLNNEPLRPKEVVEGLENGFAANQKRGTGFLFTEEAMNSYMKSNGLTHLIRSNNVFNSNGYSLQFSDKCLTVFSSSKFYENNELTTAFVDNERIRVVILDTSPQTIPNSQTV